MDEQLLKNNPQTCAMGVAITTPTSKPLQARASGFFRCLMSISEFLDLVKELVYILLIALFLPSSPYA